MVPTFLVTIPFQKQVPGVDIVPDKDTPSANYTLRIRAYGTKILRVSVGFDEAIMDDSVMLDMHPDLKVEPLQFEKNDEVWNVIDSHGTIRASLNRSALNLDLLERSFTRARRGLGAHLISRWRKSGRIKCLRPVFFRADKMLLH